MNEDRKVAALFVRRDSIYKTMPGVDCYDIDRDARTFPGGMPIVAHPPCRTWGKLKHFAMAPEHEHELGIWAVERVRDNGGVVEHPEGSSLFKVTGCAVPFGLPDEYGGIVIVVDQFNWGHACRKRTLLYIVGFSGDLKLKYKNGSPTHVITSMTGKKISKEDRMKLPNYKPELGRNKRDITPPEFAEFLVSIARQC